MGFKVGGAATGAASGAATGAAFGPWGALAGGVLGGALGGFGGGEKERNYSRSLLSKGQQRIQGGLENAAMNQGAGGAFGDSADYYRDILSNDSQTNAMMAAPEMRRFNEQIVPDLAEQFAGMGSGGLSSSGFRNAAVNAGTDLSERLGSIRAQLRSQGAAGLAGIGQSALGHNQENITRPATQGAAAGFMEGIAPGVGQALPGVLKDAWQSRNTPAPSNGPGVGGAQTGRISR